MKRYIIYKKNLRDIMKQNFYEDYTNGIFKYIAFNEWQKEGDSWYRSNAEGIAYQNEWFKDTDGKWYYFGNDCKMVTNKLVNGYWIGADGVWVK